MILRKAFQFKLKPDGATCRKLFRFCGCARFVYNKALAWNRDQRSSDPDFKISYAKLCEQLPEWKSAEETKWLSECHSQVLQQSLKDLMRAFTNFFEGRADFPKFHKKFRNEDSIRYPQGFKVDEARRQIFLPSIGWVKYRRSRFIEGKPKNVTVSRKVDGWYVSVQTEREVPEPVHPVQGDEAGIDMGVVRLYTCSDGTYEKGVRCLRDKLDKLAKEQRRLKRMVKFSKNWIKQQQRIARLHKTVADSRRDLLQKASNRLCQNHAVLYREDLKIKNMTASSSGTVEEPGRNVKQKSGLNRAILDQGWGMFFSLLNAKMTELGGLVFAVPPQNTSRTCPVCGCVSKENRRTQAKFRCTSCGYEDNADAVVAINILGRGQRLRACGELVPVNAAQVSRPSRKGRVVQQQEPVEATVGGSAANGTVGNHRPSGR